MLDSLSFKRKISLLIIASITGLLVLAVVSVLQARQQIADGRRNELVAAVQSEYNTIRGFQAAAEAGKMSTDAAQNAAREAVRHARYGGDNGKTNYFYILTSAGVGVMHPMLKTWDLHQSLIGTKNAQGVDTVKNMVDAAGASKDATLFVESFVARPGDTDPNAKLLPKLQYLMKVPGWDWLVGSGLYTDDVDVQVRDAVLRVLAIVAVVLAGIGGLGYVITRSVLRQLGGEPADAIAAMNEVARGNLAIELKQPVPGSLLAALSAMLVSLRQMVSQVRQSADSIQVASSEVATGNQDLSVRTEQTASNLQQTASSMEHLTETVKQSADAAKTANGLADAAAEVARRGGAVVTQVVATMDDINASSKKISDIIGVIDGIAFQTNILALNAAVEAARAGEQGRGFAVVASEVRSLAQRSAEAAKEIKVLIGNSVQKVETGSRLVGDAGSTMSEIVSSVKRVTDIIAEITAAAEEQSSGIGQVNTAVSQLDQMTQQNAALVEESAAAAESLKDQAHTLASAVGTFRL